MMPKMARESKNGLTVPNTKVSTNKEGRTASVFINGQMEVNIEVTGSTIKLKDLEFTNGKTDESTKESG